MFFRNLKRTVKLAWILLIVTLRETVLWLFCSNRKTVTDDVILITGGGRGIGRSLALLLAKHQPKHIILWGRTQFTLSQTAKDVQEQGVNCAYMICDVSSKEQIYSMAKEVEAKFGQVTMVINNAGVVHASSILDSDPENTELTFRTNTLSHFWTTRAFLSGMIQNNKGHIVAINSILGVAGLNGAADYCTSKFAASGFTEALRDELKSTGISGVKVTSVYPYHVDNSMFAGISTRFPSLFAPISEEYVSHKIVDAILADRDKLIVPKLMYLVALFYSIAPVSAAIPIIEFLEVHKAMDRFHEHQRRSSSHAHIH